MASDVKTGEASNVHVTFDQCFTIPQYEMLNKMATAQGIRVSDLANRIVVMHVNTAISNEAAHGPTRAPK